MNPGPAKSGFNPGPIALLAMLGMVAVGGIYAFSGTGGAFFKTGSGASTPPTGTVAVYAKSDKLMYSKNDAGVETALGGTSGAVTGTGTANVMPKFTAASVIGNSGFSNTSGAIMIPASGDTMQFSAGDYPKQINIGGATSGFPALASQVGALLVVTGDGLGNWAPLKASALFAITGNVEAGQDIVSNRYIYIATGGHYGLMTNPVEGVLSAKEGNATTAGWFQNTAGRSYATADQTVDSATLTADDTVTISLKAGRKYHFSFEYFFTSGDTVADGFQINLDGGSATATGIIGEVEILDNTGVPTAVTNSKLSALNTTASVATQPATSFTVRISGFIEVNAAGPFLPKFAKNADVGTGVTKKKYSAVLVEDFP